MVGFYYATQPRAGYASFPAYLEHLATVSPIYVRNKVLDAYLRWTPGEKPTYDEILADVNSFLAFLKRGFSDPVSYTHLDVYKRQSHGCLTSERVTRE